MDFKFVNNGTLSAAIYLMPAWHLKGNAKGRDTYREFVERNASKLDADEKILFERNLQMVNAQAVVACLTALSPLFRDDLAKYMVAYKTIAVNTFKLVGVT